MHYISPLANESNVNYYTYLLPFLTHTTIIIILILLCFMIFLNSVSCHIEGLAVYAALFSVK